MSCKSSFRSFSFYSKHDTVSDSRYLLICRNARRDAINDPSGFPGARAGVDFHRGYKGKHLPKEYIERGQIYFGFEVDEKVLPFDIEEFGDQCWVYSSDIPHGDRLYGASMSSSNETISARRASKNCSSITPRAFTEFKPEPFPPSTEEACPERSRRD